MGNDHNGRSRLINTNVQMATPISLTPCFSWVWKRHQLKNRFNGLPHTPETAETVLRHTKPPFTQLKQVIKVKVSVFADSASRLLCLLLVPSLLLTLTACKRSNSSEETSNPLPSPQQASISVPFKPSEKLVRIHWLGKKRLSAETNAAGFMQIWNMPQAVRLEAQTLDKLALALVRTNLLPYTNSQVLVTNYASQLKGPSAFLRPLLDDLLQAESYWEADSQNSSSLLVIAMKLDESRHLLWQSNLLSAAKTWSGGKSSSADTTGWQVQLPTLPLFLRTLMRSGSTVSATNSPAATAPSTTLELRRSANWTLIGLGPTDNPLLKDFRARIERDHAPFAQRDTNFWLEADNVALGALLNLITPALGQGQDLPAASFTAIGDGTNVITRGKFVFASPLPIQLDPWNIPTNLISSPLVSFTAVRGLSNWLSSWKPWNDLHVGTAPNQIYSWALQGLPMLTYFAAPSQDASNVVSKMTSAILEKGTNFFATNDVVKFERSEGSNLLAWKGLPAISPFLRFAATNSAFILAGFFPLSDTNQPPPVELIHQVSGGATNLLYYDWELTGPRSDHWLYLGQFLRFGFYSEQLTGDTRAFLDSATPKLGNCGTALNLIDPATFSISRRSTVGFTAVELHLLADWLESPNFPIGLHSFIPAPQLTEPTLPPSFSPASANTNR